VERVSVIRMRNGQQHYLLKYSLLYFFKGQFICGEKRCDENEGLKSWEVLFGYSEHGKKRDALVKLSE